MMLARPFVIGVFGLVILSVMSLPRLSQAESKEPTAEDLIAAAHPLHGIYWLKSVHDESGELLWSGGQDDARVTMDVSTGGDVRTLAACNATFGAFDAVTEGAAGRSVKIAPPGMRITRIMCYGGYPPVVAFDRIAGFERDVVELRLFDASGLLVATYIDMQAMALELELGFGQRSSER